MSYIEFESSREKERKRQWEREAREAILEKAKNKYEANKLKEEARRQRGEHVWMLPSVNARIDSESQEKKHKKKKKKEKKKKKKKSKVKDVSSSSSSESDESEMWVEKPTTSISNTSVKCSTEEKQKVSQESTKRDGWMEMTSLFKTYSRDEIKEMDGTSRKKEKEEERRRKQEADKPGSHARELNPYFKNGGCGLPEEERVNTSSSPAIGLDAKWLRKALERAKEQSVLENKTLEEIAAQRWGSLEKFNELLAEAERKETSRSSSFWKNSGRQKERNQPWTQDSRDRHRDRYREGSSYQDGRSENRERSRNREMGNNRRREERSRSRDRGNRNEYRRREERSKNQDRRSKNRERSSSSSSSRSNSSSNSEKEKNSDRSRSKDWRRNKKRSPTRGESGNKDHDRSKKREKKRRSSSSSSDSSSGSSSNSSDRNSNRTKDVGRNKSLSTNERYWHPSKKCVSGLMKPAEESYAESKSSILAGKFHKPGEEQEPRRSSNVSSRMTSSSNRGWQKKEYIQEQPKNQGKSKLESSSSSSSSSETSDEESVDVKTLPNESPKPAEKSEVKVVLTDKEMNELAAKIMKAELVGNDALASKLKIKLEAARSNRAKISTDSRTSEKEAGTQEEVVVLCRTSAQGFSRPVNAAETDKGRKRQGKMKTHGKDGKRERYFPDDDRYDFKRMFEAEKGTTAEDQNAMFSRAVMKNNERLNDDYDVDDMFMSKAVLKEDAARQAEREKKKAVQEHQRSERSLESCQWCFDNKEMTKHLIVALGSKAYICVPHHESLTSGHCLIVPIHHVMCSVQADEDLWSEIQSFRKSLVRMFNSRDEDCIFFETAKRFRNYPHMVIHCVPLPKDIGDMAPIYFKKAIMECEAEWAQNKKLVELKNRDVRRAVPKGLPYFFIDFAMDPGFAHVIEDEQDFPHNFAQEIVGGMLDLDQNLWRKPRKENFEAQRKKVMEFSRYYKDFDITRDDK